MSNKKNSYEYLAKLGTIMQRLASFNLEIGKDYRFITRRRTGPFINVVLIQGMEKAYKEIFEDAFSEHKIEDAPYRSDITVKLFLKDIKKADNKVVQRIKKEVEPKNTRSVQKIEKYHKELEDIHANLNIIGTLLREDDGEYIYKYISKQEAAYAAKHVGALITSATIDDADPTMVSFRIEQKVNMPAKQPEFFKRKWVVEVKDNVHFRCDLITFILKYKFDMSISKEVCLKQLLETGVTKLIKFNKKNFDQAYHLFSESFGFGVLKGSGTNMFISLNATCDGLIKDNVLMSYNHILKSLIEMVDEDVARELQAAHWLTLINDIPEDIPTEEVEDEIITDQTISMDTELGRQLKNAPDYESIILIIKEELKAILTAQNFEEAELSINVDRANKNKGVVRFYLSTFTENDSRERRIEITKKLIELLPDEFEPLFSKSTKLSLYLKVWRKLRSDIKSGSDEENPEGDLRITLNTLLIGKIGIKNTQYEKLKGKRVLKCYPYVPTHLPELKEEGVVGLLSDDLKELFIEKKRKSFYFRIPKVKKKDDSASSQKVVESEAPKKELEPIVLNDSQYRNIYNTIPLKLRKCFAQEEFNFSDNGVFVDKNNPVKKVTLIVPIIGKHIETDPKRMGIVLNIIT